MTVRPKIADLAPEPFEVVEISRGKVAVFGVSMTDIDGFIRGHEDVFGFVDDAIRTGSSFKISDIATRFPGAAADIVQLACRPENEAEAEILGRLGPDDVLEIVLTAIHITIPGGLSGFFGRLGAKVASMMPEPAAVTQDPALAAISDSQKSSRKPSLTPRKPAPASTRR